MIVLSCLNQSFFHTLTDKNSWHYPVLMNLEGILVTVTIFMIVTVIENSCWFEKCNQQIRLRLMFFSLSSIGLIESMDFLKTLRKAYIEKNHIYVIFGALHFFNKSSWDRFEYGNSKGRIQTIQENLKNCHQGRSLQFPERAFDQYL